VRCLFVVSILPNLSEPPYRKHRPFSSTTSLKREHFGWVYKTDFCRSGWVVSVRSAARKLLWDMVFMACSTTAWHITAWSQSVRSCLGGAKACKNQTMPYFCPPYCSTEFPSPPLPVSMAYPPGSAPCLSLRPPPARVPPCQPSLSFPPPPPSSVWFFGVFLARPGRAPSHDGKGRLLSVHLPFLPCPAALSRPHGRRPQEEVG